MLRNKLSKLIVSIMAAIMISGTGFTGQVVKASMVQTQTTTTTNTSVKITLEEQQIINEINNGTVSITKQTTFTKPIIDALNTTNGVNIEVFNNGSIVLPTGTSLNGRGNVAISRMDIMTNTGALIIVEGEVSISGVKFNNGQGTIISGNPNSVTKLELTDNVVDAGQFIATDLFEKTTSNTTSSSNQIIIGNGTSLAGTAVVFDESVVGITDITVNGRVSGITGDITLEIQEKNTNTIVPASAKIDANGKFTHKFDGLKPNTTYVITAKYVDGTTNKTITKTETTNKIEFKTSTTNISTTSANINITANVVPANGTVTLAVRDSNGNNLAGYSKTINFNNSTSFTEVVTGLTPNTQYSYQLIYTVQNQAPIEEKGTFTTLNSSLVTGGGNNGSSTIVVPEITSSDISKSTIKDVTATLEVSNNTAYNSLRDAQEITTNIKGVTATFTNGKLELKGLVPEKDYTNLELTYINRDGRKGTIKVAKFTTKKSETKIRQFVTDVYRYALDRLADEEGFAYWVSGLNNKTITPDTLVKNLLNEKEFIEKHTTTESKIEGLYQVIVNRKSDAEGLKFWTNKYDGLVKTGYSDAMALRILVDQMVNEQEFKNRVKDLGL